jgi:hypothetical protein
MGSFSIHVGAKIVAKCLGGFYDTAEIETTVPANSP